MFQEALKEIDKNGVSINQDDRGVVAHFESCAVTNLHAASIKPGAVRGNHVHDQNEIVCIMGGEGLCEIEVEDSQTGTTKRVQVDESVKVFWIKMGIKHTVYNMGEKTFYLLSFLTKRESDFPETAKMPAKNHFADIMGINLEYALETYDWQNWYPMTDNGVTVTGFGDKRKGVPDPEVYELDERGVYVRKN